MYLNTYNDNASLFRYYADLVDCTANSKKQYLKSEQYYLKSLKLDYNNDCTHNNYAILCEDRLNDQTKAEMHYTMAVELYPNEANLP